MPTLNLPPSAPDEVMNDRSRWAQARESRAYCHEVQNGPYDLIDTAWRHAMDPIIKEIIDAVPHQEASLLTIGATWNLETDVEASREASIDPGLIHRNLEREIANVAMERDISRFDPSG